MIDVAIIGAGMAGLACARRLTQGGLCPVLFDKGRGIGGRIATRRTDTMQFDHGAQYVTAKGDGFAGLLRDLAATGAVAPWVDGPDTAPLVGIPGMSSLTKAMAGGLDIRQTAQITALRPVAGGWNIQVGDTRHRAARVVLTIPAPQVAGVLGADHPLAVAVAGVRYAPGLTLMAAVDAPAPFSQRNMPQDDLAWIAQDNSKPGRAPGLPTTWVAHASAAFSARHLERDAPGIAALMVPLLCDRLGIAPDRVAHAAAHRWRYAHVTAALGQPFLRSADGRLYLGGDWCLGPRAEAAWNSGTALADDLLAHLP